MPPAIDRLPAVVLTPTERLVVLTLECVKVFKDRSGDADASLSGRGSDGKRYYIRIVDRGPTDLGAIGTSPSGGTCGAGNLALRPVTGNFVGHSSRAKPKPQ